MSGRLLTMSKDSDMLEALEQHILEVVGQRSDLVENELTGYCELWLRSECSINHRAAVYAAQKFIPKYYGESHG